MKGRFYVGISLGILLGLIWILPEHISFIAFSAMAVNNTLQALKVIIELSRIILFV